MPPAIVRLGRVRRDKVRIAPYIRRPIFLDFMKVVKLRDRDQSEIVEEALGPYLKEQLAQHRK